MKHPKVHTTKPNLHVQIFTFISFMHLNLGQSTAHNTKKFRLYFGIWYDVKFPAAKTVGSGVQVLLLVEVVQNTMGHSKYAGGYWELWIHDFKIKSTHWFFCAMSKRNGCKSQGLGGKRWSDRWWVEREKVYIISLKEYLWVWVFVCRGWGLWKWTISATWSSGVAGSPSFGTIL